MALLLAGMTLVGCSTEDSVFFTRTVVTTDENGALVQTHERVSLRDQILAKEAREALERSGVGVQQSALHTTIALRNYSSCPSTALQVWDQTNYTGNELCFSANNLNGDWFSYLDLANICLVDSCSLSWWSRVRTYYVPNNYVPNEQGYFQDGSGNQSFWDCYNNSSQCWGHLADFTGQNARYIFIDYNNIS